MMPAGGEPRARRAQQWDHKGPDGWYVAMRLHGCNANRPECLGIDEESSDPVWLPEIKKGLRADARNPL